MVFLRVCLIYKGRKVYCHLESTARQPWSVQRQLCTAAPALCLLHVFKLPSLNPAFCSSRNTLAAWRAGESLPPPPRAPLSEAQASLIPLSITSLPALTPGSPSSGPSVSSWPPRPILPSSAGPPEMVTNTQRCKGF